MTSEQQVNLVLLPGLDGTGILYAPFLKALPDNFYADVIDYPTHEIKDYVALRQDIVHALPQKEPFVLVAESFAGPLALQIAGKGIPNLRGIVLSASFIHNPYQGMKALLKPFIRPSVLRRTPPKWLLRYLLVGRSASDKLLNAIIAALQGVSPQVIAARIREVLDVDAEKLLRDCPVPILYLRGKQDRLIGKKAYAEIKQMRPDVHYAPINAPHFVMQIATQDSIAVIVKFCRDLGYSVEVPHHEV